MPYLGEVSLLPGPGGGGYLGDVGIVGPGGGGFFPDLGGVVQVRYVRTAGSNTNDGLTPATAWATLVYACSQIPNTYKNGVFVIDITGINEQLPEGFTLPFIFSDTQFLVYAPGLFGVAAAFTIHSDLSPFLVVNPADIVSITPTPTTSGDIISTSLVLVPGSLKGKIVTEFGFPFGTVIDNDATDIFTDVQGLNAAFPITINDPGAILTTDGTPGTPTLSIRSNYASILIEGVDIQAPQSNNALSVAIAVEQVIFIGNRVETFAVSDIPGSIFMQSNYIIIASGGSNFCQMSSPLFFFNCVFDQLFFSQTEATVLGEGLTFSGCAIDTCSPLGAGFGGFNRNEQLRINNTVFTNPTANGINMRGVGVLELNACTFDGCGSSPVVLDGQIDARLSTLPPGIGNGGVGVELHNDAHCEAIGVTLTGAGGDVQIGHLPATTWALVNAAPNNRITDAGVNGDGSSARST